MQAGECQLCGVDAGVELPVVWLSAMMVDAVLIPIDFVFWLAWVFCQRQETLSAESLRHLFENLARCRDISKHPRCSFEVGGDQVPQQPLVNVLLVVDAVLFHHSLEARPR